jgi:hypothetical protein
MLPDQCFVAGTPVWTDRGPVPIESITVGMRVLAPADDAGPQLAGDTVAMTVALPHGDSLARLMPAGEVLPVGAALKRVAELAPGDAVTVDGERGVVQGLASMTVPPPAPATRLVTATLALETPLLVDVRTDAGVVRATPEHPFFTADRGWVAAGALGVGEPVETRHPGRFALVRAVEPQEVAPTRVYNFVVADTHTYYVGEDALLVHNGKCRPGPYPMLPNNTPIIGDNGLGPLPPNGALKFDPVKSECLTPSELQQLAQDEYNYTADGTWNTNTLPKVDNQGNIINPPPADGPSNNRPGQSGPGYPSCAVVLCDSLTGRCYGGQAGRPYGPNLNNNGTAPRNTNACTKDLANGLKFLGVDTPENWDQLNCAEKRALLGWMNDYVSKYGKPNSWKAAIANSGLFLYAVGPNSSGTAVCKKGACGNCQSALPKLGIYSVSDGPNARMNQGLRRPGGLC